MLASWFAGWVRWSYCVEKVARIWDVDADVDVGVDVDVFNVDG